MARGTTNRGEEILALSDRFTVSGGKVLFSGSEKIIRPDAFSLIAPEEAGSATARKVLVEAQKAHPSDADIAGALQAYKK